MVEAFLQTGCQTSLLASRRCEIASEGVTSIAVDYLQLAVVVRHYHRTNGRPDDGVRVLVAV